MLKGSILSTLAAAQVYTHSGLSTKVPTKSRTDLSQDMVDLVERGKQIPNVSHTRKMLCSWFT
ncbi:hypothetical protein OH492_09085 [Vibrio chagasii]|nr:hypothetical protein [Vibrio chagasii]